MSVPLICADDAIIIWYCTARCSSQWKNRKKKPFPVFRPCYTVVAAMAADNSKNSNVQLCYIFLFFSFFHALESECPSSFYALSGVLSRRGAVKAHRRNRVFVIGYAVWLNRSFYFTTKRHPRLVIRLLFFRFCAELLNRTKWILKDMFFFFFFSCQIPR